MKFSSLLSLSALTSLAAGHAYVWGIHINGKDMGRGDANGGYIRKVNNNDPVKDVKSADMTCNRNHGPASRSLDVKGGDKIVVEWAHNNRGDDIIASSHKGPVQVYVASATSSGKGPVWVKVASDGFSGGQWATDRLRANKGRHTFTMPHVNPGSYLIRPEIVALHEGSKVGGAQLYMVCVHFTCHEEMGEWQRFGVEGR
jgi:lytic cellulose monooxygenase (C1-hydroxylating)